MVNEQGGQRSRRYGLLYGSYEVSIDDKARVPVASELRKAISPERDGHAFFVMIGSNRKIWAYPAEFYEQLVEQMEPDLMAPDETLDFDHLNFASAVRREWDDQGRIQLPPKFIERTQTSRKVTLIGSRDHLEIWNRDEWEARFDELDKRRPEIVVQARAVRRQAREGERRAEQTRGTGVRETHQTESQNVT